MTGAEENILLQAAAVLKTAKTEKDWKTVMSVARTLHRWGTGKLRSSEIDAELSNIRRTILQNPVNWDRYAKPT